MVYVVAYFIIYSFFGWVMESVLKTVEQKKFVNSGFLYGAYCPIYGFGALIMLFALQQFKDNIIILFLISFFVLSIWEYIVGWLLEIIFKTKYWDYTTHKFNIHGRVCLLNSLFWGFLGVVFIHFLHPFIESKVNLIPNEILTYVVAILSVAMIVDLIISVIKLSNLQNKLNKINELNDLIKQKLSELKNAANTTNNIQEVVEELKHKQSIIKRKLIKQTIRLKKAFPTMKSDAIEKINEFLTQKKNTLKRNKKE